jgi:hypothetical protein
MLRPGGVLSQAPNSIIDSSRVMNKPLAFTGFNDNCAGAAHGLTGGEV